MPVRGAWRRSIVVPWRGEAALFLAFQGSFEESVATGQASRAPVGGPVDGRVDVDGTRAPFVHPR